MKPDPMDAVFSALASRPRRRMLDLVKENPGCAVGEVCEHFEISRIAVMKHLRVLEEAGLLISEKEGRVRRLYHNAVPIQMIYDRWTSEYSKLWASGLTRLKYRVEGEGKKRRSDGATERRRGGGGPRSEGTT